MFDLDQLHIATLGTHHTPINDNRVETVAKEFSAQLGERYPWNRVTGLYEVPSRNIHS